MRSVNPLTLVVVTVLLAAAAPAAPGPARDAGTEPAAEAAAFNASAIPGEPHRILAATAGRFDMTVKSWIEPPPAEPVVSRGEAVRTMILGGRVLEETTRNEFMGTRFEGLGHTGYDNVTGRYWSTWMDTMGTGCFVSHGSRDEASGVMTFEGSYADPASGETKRARMVITPRDEGGSLFEWFDLEDGAAHRTIEIVYRPQAPAAHPSTPEESHRP